MADNTKVTKKDMFKAILALASEVNRPDIEEFVTHEIELLDKRYAAKTGKVSKAKQEEQDAYMEQIKGILAASATPMRTKDIAAALDITPQKASPILRKMQKEDIIVGVTEKKVIYYSLAADALGE